MVLPPIMLVAEAFHERSQAIESTRLQLAACLDYVSLDGRKQDRLGRLIYEVLRHEAVGGSEMPPRMLLRQLQRRQHPGRVWDRGRGRGIRSGGGLLRDEREERACHKIRAVRDKFLTRIFDLSLQALLCVHLRLDDRGGAVLQELNHSVDTKRSLLDQRAKHLPRLAEIEGLLRDGESRVERRNLLAEGEQLAYDEQLSLDRPALAPQEMLHAHDRGGRLGDSLLG
mmetsp:Transcript_16833/g.37762  ORF Transcript_16833/g.37762 Transcript_16833/m.37762 type:complete len:227 (-) Transcript_16833:180-860(-)